MKKKFLLGTTALFAASVVAGGMAQAAEEPIQAGVGGYYRAAMGFVSQDESDGELADNAQSIALSQDIEIKISGSTTLDNGITAGFQALIEGNTASSSESSALDERFIFFRGSFGQIRVGSTESARQEFTNFAPSGNYNFGVNTPFFLFANPGNSSGIFDVATYNDFLGVEDSIKLVYFSPTFNGFRLGASYAPDDDEFGAYGQNTANDVGELQNQTAVALEFSRSFGDFNIRLMGGYESYVLERCNAAANTQTCDDTPAAIQGGGTISFGEWSIGGGYLKSDQVTQTATGADRDREDFDIGIAWWSGPFGVGLQWGSLRLDQVDNTTDDLDIYELNATYVLGPGIDVGAAFDIGDFDDGTVGGLDNSWTSFKLSTALVF